jgi:drug/metabolite transporter (DMT)-like permease
MAVRRPQTFAVIGSSRRMVVSGLIGGTASFIAYGLVIWAFTQAPIALVAALRETSIVFALLIGVGVLKERLNLAKVAATLVTLLGAVLLRAVKP